MEVYLVGKLEGQGTRVCSWGKVQWETFEMTVRWSCFKFSSKYRVANYADY